MRLLYSGFLLWSALYSWLNISACFFLMIKTVLTKVPHVHTLIFKTSVLSATVKIVSMSGFHAPHDWWLFEDGWMNLIHSPRSPRRLYVPLFTGMLEYATCFLVTSIPSSYSSRETTLRCSVCPGPPLPPPSRKKPCLAPLRTKSRAEVPACLCPLFFTWSLLLSAEGCHGLVQIHASWLLLESIGPKWRV